MSLDLTDADRLKAEARTSIASYREYLASPAFQHQIDLAILVKVAGNEAAPMRERLRAAEILGRFRLDAMAAVAGLTGVREQSLDALGIKAGPQSVSMTQVNQKIEIVRASDWRNAPALEESVIDVEPDALPPASTSAHAGNGHAGHGRDDYAADPAP